MHEARIETYENNIRTGAWHGKGETQAEAIRNAQRAAAKAQRKAAKGGGR